MAKQKAAMEERMNRLDRHDQPFKDRVKVTNVFLKVTMVYNSTPGVVCVKEVPLLD